MTIPLPARRRHDRLLTTLAAPLLLGGCGIRGGEALSDAELNAAYLATPASPLPTLSTSPLGEAYTFQGRVKDWKASEPVDLYGGRVSGARPAISDGLVSPDGTITFRAPLLNLASTPRNLLEERGLKPEGYCPVNTTKLSQDVKVRVLYPTLSYVRADTGTKAQTSPAIGIFGTLVQGVTLLVWAPEPLTVQGEQRCLYGNWDATGNNPAPVKRIYQHNVLINVKLERGWNALTVTAADQGSLTQGVTIFARTWAAAPAADLTKWAAYPYN